MRIINNVPVLDSLGEFVDPRHCAVVVIDMQKDFCDPAGHYARHGKNIATTLASVPGTVEFVAAAQARGILTAFVQQTTLPNGMSDSPAWLRFKCRDGKSPEYTLKGSWGAEFAEGLVPAPSDLVIEKYRPDAFLRTPLDALLRAKGIQSLVILGTSTEGCVESTIRGGSYHDYYVVAVKDLITSTNPALHEGSMRLVEARYPTASSAEIRAVWDRMAPAAAR